MKSLILLALLAYTCQGQFILPAINLDSKTFQDCQTCDARSDRAGTRAAAGAIREFMTQNHVKVAVDSGEVRVTQAYPNEGISTGHSCSVTAEARNVRATAAMLPGTVQLSPEGVVYADDVQNSIAVAEVGHSLSVALSIRVQFGQMLFGHCSHVARKTCDTYGYSQGINKIAVNLAASNVLAECIDGQEYLTFDIDVKVVNEKKDNSYSAVQVGKHSGCHLDILGITIASLNKKVQSYANRYIHSGDKFSELRGPKLVARLEKTLGAKLGSTVTIKVNDEHGVSRTCPRIRSLSSCVHKNCPAGFTRIGETEECQKFFGSAKPNCAVYGQGATVYTKTIGGIVMYWCHVPMV